MDRPLDWLCLPASLDPACLVWLACLLQVKIFESLRAMLAEYEGQPSSSDGSSGSAATGPRHRRKSSASLRLLRESGEAGTSPALTLASVHPESLQPAYQAWR